MSTKGDTAVLVSTEDDRFEDEAVILGGKGDRYPTDSSPPTLLGKAINLSHHITGKLRGAISRTTSDSVGDQLTKSDDDDDDELTGEGVEVGRESFCHQWVMPRDEKGEIVNRSEFGGLLRPAKCGNMVNSWRSEQCTTEECSQREENRLKQTLYTLRRAEGSDTLCLHWPAGR
ncbi:uncharacterized protein IL334_006838 [Kwoniella shivajii]|uniref:Uncharacterized protein n=1 Tax=Kwoniella shivajii TaxID=564305 RepID=A0ABZ1D723_9TREE|nr:hypothetical protein IL334_006838 [Kwoniella shivajii]